MLPFFFACSSQAPHDLTTADTVLGDDTDRTTDSSPPLTLSTAGTIDHLSALAAIAAEHDGSRHAGSSGYDASAAYVVERLEEAGYEVVRDAFSFERFEELSPAVLEVVDGNAYTVDADFSTMTYSGKGDVTASIEAVDVTIPPDAQSNSSTSGCEASDFADFTAGSIALIQRGTCTFADKARNAESAGAVGVVLFNEGQEGRQDVFASTLDPSSPATIPVVSSSYAIGEVLAAELPVTHLRVDAEITETVTENILAQTTGRDDRILVIGAHLDSVSAGAGINDNGSGSAAILELAEELARVEHAPLNQIRFAFWGAEELGLLGSTSYVSRLSEVERSTILANLNFDMIASPNYGRFIYDGDGDPTGIAGPEGSAQIEALFVEHFERAGLASAPTGFSGRSDYGPFIAVGIPAGGLFTGAEARKSSQEASLFGGEADVAFDACYHQGCDGLENINLTGLSEMSEAAFAVALALADDEAPLGQASSAARPPVNLEAAMRTPERRGKHFQR